MTTYKRFSKLFAITAILFSLPLQTLFAKQFSIPQPNDSLIGDVVYMSASGNQSLLSIGQANNIGYNAIFEANPGYAENATLPSGAAVTVPSQFLLPSLPRQGIIINLAEMRMYYFPKGASYVLTYPIGIGRVSRTVPLGMTSIARKTVNPTWTPPNSIREFQRAQGVELPKKIGPGPDNPLGPFAIYLKIPTFLMHSTLFPESIGRRASFGCIRMNETDIKEFFPIVQPGTPVAIVDIANKVGWDDGKLYLESHSPLEESHDDGIAGVVTAIQEALPKTRVTIINWQLLSYLNSQRDGIPHEIGFQAK